MQRSTPIRRALGPILVAVALLAFVFAPVAHAVPGPEAPGADGPSWVQSIPTWLQSWTQSFLDLWSGGDDRVRPVSVHDRAGSSVDPSGSPGAEATSTELQGPTIFPTDTDSPTI